MKRKFILGALIFLVGCSRLSENAQDLSSEIENQEQAASEKKTPETKKDDSQRDPEKKNLPKQKDLCLFREPPFNINELKNGQPTKSWWLFENGKYPLGSELARQPKEFPPQGRSFGSSVSDFKGLYNKIGLGDKQLAEEFKRREEFKNPEPPE
ncbi:hypothetical protein AGMMS50296_4050 [Alphaproteobacteria bacterium]|nr:hypothetical protein AGMMS50296_4050 [Alphaproteobacteria bacterium]